ncbi:MAG: hypothetical protein C0417_08160 [Chlorobiaceae bacterium]|nr:hypothetical protein [Chlorobiaceae bacterium]
MNWFIKPRITKAFADAYPTYSIHITNMNYSILKNRFGFDSVSLRADDGTFLSTMGQFSVSGVSWTHLLWGRSLAFNDFANSVVDVHDIVIAFPQFQYKLNCESLHISMPDSEIVVNALELQPPVDDEQFFAQSKFRKTRYRLVIPQCRATGLSCLELLNGKNYRARAAQIYNASLSVLINKDKPVNSNSLSPRMPNVVLSSIKESIQIDSIRIMNGRLIYNERFGVGLEPAVLTFDSMQVSICGIDNHGNISDTAVICAQGMLMNTGAMSLRMSIPVASPEFSFRYSGFLSGMNLSEFNPFIEVAEHKRFKTGSLQSAVFDVQVISGSAKGNVRALYKDMKIISINSSTGSESGVGNTIVSFIANNMKLRTTNIPDKLDSMKIGEVKYMRKSDETFFEYAWFALRSGIGDVVGF